MQQELCFNLGLITQIVDGKHVSVHDGDTNKKLKPYHFYGVVYNTLCLGLDISFYSTLFGFSTLVFDDSNDVGTLCCLQLVQFV
jgi:hypothetical protein